MQPPGNFEVILREKNGVLFFQFPNLSEFTGIRHGIFSRHGGCSPEPFQSLNVSVSVGDTHSNVERNRGLISQCLKGEELIFAKQIHGTKIRRIAKDNKVDTGTAADAAMTGDGLITDVPKKNLSVKVADCQSVLVYDPVGHVAANVHSGWRGSIKNIIGLAIKKMERNFGCRPGDIQAGISPSLGPCCATFINYRKEIPKKYWGYKDKADRFDFWAISRDQLVDAGVPPENICTSEICTRCNTGHFFSYRKEGTTGRFAAVVGLR